MSLFSVAELEAATRLVHSQMAPTPAYAWPLLQEEIRSTVWLKHENHTPTGAFKVRGGITFMDWLAREHPDANGIITATRGNHGQSQALAASRAGLRSVVYVPHGNSVEKNEAMRAFGAELVEFGVDFDEAREEAKRVASKEGLYFVPSFHRELVRGVATYAFELFIQKPDIDTVYVPIGCGSGICGVIAARDTLDLETEVVGVVSTEADAAKLSFEAGRPIHTESATTFADGVAVRMVVPEALEIYGKGAARVVAVSEEEIAAAIRLIYRTTHNVAEGAGAAPLAAAMKERERNVGRNVACILCGGNIDADKLAVILAGGVPDP